MAIEPIKGFYVHDEVTDTDGVAKVSIEAVQEFEDDIRDETSKWLDEHPEATTTVQDGAVTTPKIADGAVTYAKLDGSLKAFVTPEMFGAVGDGVTDDAVAVQNAINSGFPVCFLSKKLYRIAQDVTIPNFSAVFGLDENASGNNSENILLDNSTLILSERKITIKNLSIKAQNAQVAFTYSAVNNTDICLDNILLNGFQTCFYFSQGTSSYIWRLWFTRVHTINCPVIIDYSTNYNGFNINFNNCYFDGIVKLQGVHATFNNCSFGLNTLKALDLKQCYVVFIGCNLENDAQVSDNSCYFDQTRCVFIGCLFYEYQTSGVFFFGQKNNSFIVFLSCEVKSKAGSVGTWWKNTGEGFGKYGNVCAWNTRDTILPQYTYSGYENSGLVFGTVPTFANVSSVNNSKLVKNQLVYITGVGVCIYDGSALKLYDDTRI